MSQQDNLVQNVESIATGAIAAASKTPFRTAFMVTFGMGLAKVTLAVIFFSGLFLSFKLIFN